MKPLKFFILIPLVFALTACGSLREAQKERLALQLSQFELDPEAINFLADEAARAGVSRIEPFTQQMLRTKGGSFGLSYPTRREIYLNQNKSGGGSVVNVSHEIAHVAVRNYMRCGCHSKYWYRAYYRIAKRFEERFPGTTWSGQRPTERVERNLTRYNIRL